MALNIAVTLIVGFLSYLLAKSLRIPAPGMIGSMLGVGFLNIGFEIAYFPLEMKIFTQMIAGAFIGIQIYKKDVISFKILYKPCLCLLFILTLNTFGVGMLIHYLCDMDLLTALLACCAGGATDISLISMDMGADTSVVALMQVLRLFIVLLVFPLWIKMITKNEEENEPSLSIDAPIENRFNGFLNLWVKTNHQRLFLTLSIALIFGLLGKLSGIPSGTLMFSMFATAFLNCTTRHAYMPMSIKTTAQIFAGALVGCTLTRDTLYNAPKLIIPMILLLLSYWLVNVLFTIICKHKKYLDMKSALFASCPGGASDMALIAGDLGADMAKIALLQVSRMVYVIAIMPILIRVFVNLVS